MKEEECLSPRDRTCSSCDTDNSSALEVCENAVKRSGLFFQTTDNSSVLCVRIQGSPTKLAFIVFIGVLAIVYKTVEFCLCSCKKQKDSDCENGREESCNEDRCPFEKAERGRNNVCLPIYSSHARSSQGCSQLRRLPQVDCVHEHASRRANRSLVVGHGKGVPPRANASCGSTRRRSLPRTRSLETELCFQQSPQQREKGDGESSNSDGGGTCRQQAGGTEKRCHRLLKRDSDREVNNF